MHIYLHMNGHTVCVIMCMNKILISLIKSTSAYSFQAIETLKGFEKKDSKVQSTAATNLSFLYFLVSLLEATKLTQYCYCHCVSVSKTITNNYQRLGSAGEIDTNALVPMLCFGLVSINKKVKMCMIRL